MIISTLKLTNFRSYKKSSFSFSDMTIIVGPNTIGKTNILEAIHFLSVGKSFRAEKDVDTISLLSDFSRIDAQIVEEDEKIELSLLLVKRPTGFSKRFLINGVGKRQAEFKTYLPTVLFAPSDLEVISGSPSLRRRYINSILFQASSEYRRAFSIFEKALKQRNRLLHAIKTGTKSYSPKEFEYWEDLLTTNARTITDTRMAYIEYLNSASKKVFQFQAQYDKSEFTKARAEKYHDAEVATGMTLIGPQRDDFLFFYKENLPISEYGSRGEQRLTILQLKLLEIEYLKTTLEKNPILLLDDIYSELDAQNIALVTNLLPHQQTIITTTHLEQIPKKIIRTALIISLEDQVKS